MFMEAKEEKATQHPATTSGPSTAPLTTAPESSSQAASVLQRRSATPTPTVISSGLSMPQTPIRPVSTYVDAHGAIPHWYTNPMFMYQPIAYPASRPSQGWNSPMVPQTTSPGAASALIPNLNGNPVDLAPSHSLSPLLPPSSLPGSSPLPPSSPPQISSPPPLSSPLPAPNVSPDTIHALSSGGRSRAHSEEEDEDDTPSKKRLRVSLKNAPYGFVEGVMKGTQKYQVARFKAMRKLMPEVTAANKRYKREIDNIVSRCERIAEETGAWLILGAQQSGSGAPITYSSSKLRKDAIEETTSILQQFQKLTKALTTAKYHDAKELAKQLQDVLAAQETQRHQEEQKSLEVQKKLIDQEAELAAKDALIAEYRLKFGA